MRSSGPVNEITRKHFFCYHFVCHESGWKKISSVKKYFFETQAEMSLVTVGGVGVERMLTCMSGRERILWLSILFSP